MNKENLIGKRAKLSDFHRVISNETADILEKSITQSRKSHNILHKKRIEKIKTLKLETY